MKHVVVWMWLVLLAGSTVGLSQSFIVEFAYFDLSSGPLSVEPGSPTPIQDGSLCQIIEDFARDGIAPSHPDGSPGEGDRLLPLSAKSIMESSSKAAVMFNTFPLNGEQLFGSAGYFYISSGISGQIRHIAPIFLRIWNHSNPQQATAYWDTPLYRIISGHQQMMFSKAQMTFHEFTPLPSESDQNRLHPQSATSMGVVIREYAMHEAYPNPFNPTTTITFDLPEAAMVDVRIFDIMGREVRHLLDEVHSAGQFSVMFDGGNLSSGLYLVSARIGDKYMSTKKITLLK